MEGERKEGANQHEERKEMTVQCSISPNIELFYYLIAIFHFAYSDCC